jgi:hypothetical protein
LSYALLINGNWWFFPCSAGLDSGGAHGDYRKMEALISDLEETVGVEIRRRDIDYEDLKYFLLANSESIFTLYNKEGRSALHFFDEPFKITSKIPNQYDLFKERYEQRMYPQALRDLRAFVQQAQELILSEKGVDIPEKSDVTKLAELLVKEKIIDGRLLTWFISFSSIANLSAHGKYPTEKDMTDDVISNRVFLTFRIGLHLLKELNDCIETEFDRASVFLNQSSNP